MKSLFAIAVGLVFVGLTISVRADEKKKEDKKDGDVAAKIVGSWEVTKADQEELVDMTVTFDKNGEYSIGKGDMPPNKGTWKIDADGKLITARGELTDSDTIKKLTADTLELENKEGKATTLKRKK